MIKKFLVMFTMCCAVLSGSFFVHSALARTTLDKYNSSGIFVMTTKDNLELLAEARVGSLSLGTLPKGTKLVPINQVRNEQEKVVYDLVIRSDGAVGFVPADDTLITYK